MMDCEICKSPTVPKPVLMFDIVPVNLCSPCVRLVRAKIPTEIMSNIYKTEMQIQQYQDNQVCEWREAAIIDLYDHIEKWIEEMKRRLRVKHL